MHYILVVLAWFPARSSYVPPISQSVKIESFKTESECWDAWRKLGDDWRKTSPDIQLAGSCLPIKN